MGVDLQFRLSAAVSIDVVSCQQQENSLEAHLKIQGVSCISHSAGKTHLAKALARDASILGPNVSFFAADSQLLSRYVGDSEKKLRDLFALAVLNEPAILYIDEIDGIFTVSLSDCPVYNAHKQPLAGSIIIHKV